VSQVQTAQQQAVSVQILQTGAQLAGVSVPTGPGVALQSAGSITQIQIACVAQCFGGSSSSPTTLATAQQLLAELDSLLEPPDPPSATPAPGTAQSVTSQTSCQEQEGQPSSLVQVQSASESSTTVQLVEEALPLLLDSSFGDSSPNVQATSQTVQSTWQFQIGCLLDCVDSTQTQDADESNTTIESVIGPPTGSGGGLEATVTQVIWQVQIGCLVWCYGSTQIQQESTQNTVVLISASAPDPSTPDPTPVSDPATNDPPPAASGADSPPAPADPPPSSPPPSATPALPERLSFPTVVGGSAIVMVGALQSPRAATRAAVVTSDAASSPPPSLEWWRASLTIVRGVSSYRATMPHRELSVDPAGHVARRPHVARPRVLEARTDAGPRVASLALLLVLLAAALAYATFRARGNAHSDR
jgi:hypothetical protein